MYKVIKEKTNKETGISKVVIQAKEGHFVGFSFCNEDDEFSSFAGIRYAQKRAVAALFLHRAKLAKERYNAMVNLKKDFLHNNLPIPKPIKIKIRDYSNEVEYWTNSAKTLKESVLLDDKERAEILSRYYSNKQVK